MSSAHQHIQRPNSLWEDTLSAGGRCAEEPLESSIRADITIIGAGLTGLWSAYYLSQQLPDADIVVIDSAGVGFGASGRNGGWASALLPMGLERIEREHGREVAKQLQTEMHSTLDEIQRVLATEGINAAEQRGGTFTAARSATHLTTPAISSSTGNARPMAGSHSVEEEPRIISGRPFARHSIPTPPCAIESVPRSSTCFLLYETRASHTTWVVHWVFREIGHAQFTRNGATAS